MLYEKLPDFKSGGFFYFLVTQYFTGMDLPETKKRPLKKQISERISLPQLP